MFALTKNHRAFATGLTRCEGAGCVRGHQRPQLARSVRGRTARFFAGGIIRDGFRLDWRKSPALRSPARSACFGCDEVGVRAGFFASGFAIWIAPASIGSPIFFQFKEVAHDITSI